MGHRPAFGGDEFAVLFEIAPPEQAITDLCEALVDQCAAPRQFGGEDCTVSVSIGYAFGEGPPRNPPKVFVNADAALYAVKHAGRSGFKVYALDLGPVSAIASQSRHEFLAAIDACVLANVMRQQTIWAREGASYPIISVNTSAARLRAPDLIDSMCKVLEAPHKMSLELVETAFLDTIDDELAFKLNALHDLGVRIELDDFGSGHSSVVALQAIKPDQVKIDCSLIAPLANNPHQIQTLESLVRIAQLEAADIAIEGLETGLQLAAIRSLDCDVFARLCPAAAHACQ